ncbi:MAG: hypothetical protein M3Q39_06665, partial [Actinomycetota bacterium]|nr:hypothetical protein [Actinomycetota bacterium]
MGVPGSRLSAVAAAGVVAVAALGGAGGVWDIGPSAAASTAAPGFRLVSPLAVAPAPPRRVVPDTGIEPTAPEAAPRPAVRERTAPRPAAKDRTAPRPGAHDQVRNHRTLPARSGHGRRVVLDLGVQHVWLVDARDRVRRTYPVSGSKHPNLDVGRYRVYSRSRHAVSYTYEETMGFMVRFTTGERAAIGF